MAQGVCGLIVRRSTELISRWVPLIRREEEGAEGDSVHIKAEGNSQDSGNCPHFVLLLVIPEKSQEADALCVVWLISMGSNGVKINGICKAL